MAAILERLAQEVEKDHPGFAASLREQAQQARELGVRENFSVVGTEKPEIKPLTFLEQATKEYQTNPNPESLTKFFQAFWTEKGNLVGKKLVVPKFSGTVEGLEDVRKDEKMPIFDHPEVTYADLGKMFPKMGSWVVNNKIVDNNNDSGWLSIDGSIDAPHRNTTEGEWVRTIKQEGECPMSLRQYIIGSQISKLLTGKYFDQGSTWSGFSDQCDEVTLYVRFNLDGYLGVSRYMFPGLHRGSLGCRGEKEIKAA